MSLLCSALLETNSKKLMGPSLPLVICACIWYAADAAAASSTMQASPSITSTTRHPWAILRRLATATKRRELRQQGGRMLHIYVGRPAPGSFKRVVCQWMGSQAHHHHGSLQLQQLREERERHGGSPVDITTTAAQHRALTY